MSSQSCDTVCGLLVDYSDGELSAAEAGRVAAHLAECPLCRSDLRMLERSIELARSVWRESAARAPSRLPGGLRTHRDRSPKQAAVAVVACVAAVLLAAGAWWLWQPRPGGDLDPTELAAPLERPTSQPGSPAREIEESAPAPRSEDPDVETLIARVGRAARLAASAELLAAQPGLQRYGVQADRYLAEVYRGTPAGDRAATRVGLPANPANKEPES